MTIKVENVERRVMEIEEESSVGNSLDIGEHYQGGMVRFHIDNPWSGDTETGFGRDAHISISIADALALADFIIATWRK